nr:hypothetical protein FEE99_17000 [Pseudomonas sp. ef1]
MPDSEPVGAGLPAIAVGQPILMLDVPPSSLASQLPQGSVLNPFEIRCLPVLSQHRRGPFHEQCVLRSAQGLETRSPFRRPLRQHQPADRRADP